MNYIIGVDGGGSKTDYLLYDASCCRLVGRYKGGATNHEVYRQGFEAVGAELEGSLKALLQPLGIPIRDIAAGVFGMAGIDCLSQKNMAESLLSDLGFRKFIVMNDSFLGVKAGSPDGTGLCIINGAGNSIAGIDAEGNHQQVGGLGFYSGDEGGGRHIAGKVIRAVYEELFRCGERTALTPLLLSLFGIEEERYFVDRLDELFLSKRMDEKEILRLLFRCAEEGDQVAVSILDHMAREIAKSACGCIRRLRLGDETTVVLAGSIHLKAETPLVLQGLKREMSKLSDRKFTFINLEAPPAFGAVLWAYELLRGKVTSPGDRAQMLRELAQ
jgi:N-acetylglucosamine kinase-like BadF-type ATPase